MTSPDVNEPNVDNLNGSGGDQDSNSRISSGRSSSHRSRNIPPLKRKMDNSGGKSPSSKSQGVQSKLGGSSRSQASGARVGGGAQYRSRRVERDDGNEGSDVRVVDQKFFDGFVDDFDMSDLS